MRACVWSHVVAKILVFQPKNHTQCDMMSTLWEAHRSWGLQKRQITPHHRHSEALALLEWQGRIICIIQKIIPFCVFLSYQAQWGWFESVKRERDKTPYMGQLGPNLWFVHYCYSLLANYLISLPKLYILFFLVLPRSDLIWGWMFFAHSEQVSGYLM